MPLSEAAKAHKREHNREYMAQRRADPEFRARERAKSPEYEAKRQRDPEKKREYSKRSNLKQYWKDPETRRAARREYYWNDPEAERARTREYSKRPEAKERAKLYAREYRRKNPVLARARIWKKKGAPLQEKTYAEMLTRDPCSYCGRKAGEIDHITAVSKGGPSSWDNLTAACVPCNRSKFNHPLVLWLAKQHERH